jgi:integrase
MTGATPKPKGKTNGGTVRAIRNRRTGEITHYRALLPESLSKRPEGCTDPRYRQPVGPPFRSHDEAERALLLMVTKGMSVHEVRNGLPFSVYLNEVIERKYIDARRTRSRVGAAKVVRQWRSMLKTRLDQPSCPFFLWPAASIRQPDIQRWIDRVLIPAKSQGGGPLSSSFLHNLCALLRAGFLHAGIYPNPAECKTRSRPGLVLPKKGPKKIRHLTLKQQKDLFQCQELTLRERLMVGCGIGSGMRVGELLSIEQEDVFLDDHNPHLMVRYGGKDHAPTKGKKERRVELHEPGLGFWRAYMEKFADPKRVRVFAGPRGGYQANWVDRFETFAELIGLEKLSSHYMRHTYAVSMLNGSWGYEPRTLEYIQSQLGHSDILTTQHSYGEVLVGTMARETRLMTGAKDEAPRVPVTAEKLLGGRTETNEKPAEENGVSAVRRPPVFTGEIGLNSRNLVANPLGPLSAEKGQKNSILVCPTHQENTGLVPERGPEYSGGISDPLANDPVAAALVTSLVAMAERAGIENLLGQVLANRAFAGTIEVGSTFASADEESTG